MIRSFLAFHWSVGLNPIVVQGLEVPKLMSTCTVTVRVWISSNWRRCTLTWRPCDKWSERSISDGQDMQIKKNAQTWSRYVMAAVNVLLSYPWSCVENTFVPTNSTYSVSYPGFSALYAYILHQCLYIVQSVAMGWTENCFLRAYHTTAEVTSDCTNSKLGLSLISCCSDLRSYFWVTRKNFNFGVKYASSVMCRLKMAASGCSSSGPGVHLSVRVQSGPHCLLTNFFFSLHWMWWPLPVCVTRPSHGWAVHY